MPRSKRPFETWSSVVASLAASAAGYSGSTVSEVSSRSRVVAPAAAARAMKPLVTGPWKKRCSPVATPS
jgi:hypothetical protein